MPTLTLTHLEIIQQQETNVLFFAADEIRVVAKSDLGLSDSRSGSGLKTSATLTLGIVMAFRESVTVEIIEEDNPDLDPDDVGRADIGKDRGDGPFAIEVGVTDDRPSFGKGRYRLHGLIAGTVTVPDTDLPDTDLPPTPGVPAPAIPQPLHVLVDNPLQVLGLIEGLANVNSALTNGVTAELQDLGGKVDSGLAPLRDLARSLDGISRIEQALAPLQVIAIRLENLSGLAGAASGGGATDGLPYINTTLSSIESSLHELNDITAALAPLAGLPAALSDLAAAVNGIQGALGALGQVGTTPVNGAGTGTPVGG